MKLRTLVISLTFASTLMTGCSWVKVTEAGRQVAILPPTRVADCTRLGTVETSVKNKVMGINRSREKVQTELDRLAQDQAVLMRANSLVRDRISGGHGYYTAYNCP
jgi:hypothetical protein